MGVHDQVARWYKAIYTSHCIRVCALKLPVYFCEADSGQVTGTSYGMRVAEARHGLRVRTDSSVLQVLERDLESPPIHILSVHAFTP